MRRSSSSRAFASSFSRRSSTSRALAAFSRALAAFSRALASSSCLSSSSIFLLDMMPIVMSRKIRVTLRRLMWSIDGALSVNESMVHY